MTRDNDAWQKLEADMGVEVQSDGTPFPKGEKMNARVVITVSGGVADYVSDGAVDVELIDYDNEPDAVIPALFADMVNEHSYHRSKCISHGCDSLARTIPGKPDAYLSFCETCYAKMS